MVTKSWDVPKSVFRVSLCEGCVYVVVKDILVRGGGL